MPLWVTDNLIHITFAIYLVAYLFRDILYLRIVTVIAVSVEILYFYFLPEPLWPPIIWSLIFIAVNVYQVGVLVLERRPAVLSPSLQHLRQRLFPGLRPRELLKLADQGEWRALPAGARVLEEGAERGELLALVSGKVRVERGGEILAKLGPGHLLGEMSFLTGEALSATVIAESAVRVLAWEHEALNLFLDRHEHLRGSFQVAIGTDLVRKLTQRSAFEHDRTGSHRRTPPLNA